MSTKNDGGPAFPSHGTMGEVAHEGMTLRDYFAAKAMAVLKSERQGPEDDNPGAPVFEDNEIAELAYYQADAMLRARQAPMATQPPDSSAQA